MAEIIDISALVSNCELSHEQLANELRVSMQTFNGYLKNGVDRTIYTNLLAICKMKKNTFNQLKNEIAANEGYTPKKAPGFMIYSDMYPLFMKLSDEQSGALIKALLNYFVDGVACDSADGLVNMGFELMKVKVDMSQEKYVETCRKRSEAAKKKYELQ